MLKILTVHPNPFLKPPEITTGEASDETPAPMPAPEPVPENENASSNPVADHTAASGLPTLTVFTTALAPLSLQGSTSHSSLLSPPVSPPPPEQPDIEMESELLAFTGSSTESNANADVGAIGNDTMDTEDVGLTQDAELPSGDTTLTDGIWATPLHEVTRARFPSLLVLAGNTILNHMERQQQQQRQDDEKRGSRQRDDEDQMLERPRKDSKISMEDGITSASESKPEETSISGSGTSGYEFDEEVIQSYLTPFLYSLFTRARASRRCAGCQTLFLKPCRVMVVWQEVLGQNHIPIQWKGCGMGKCPGIPLKMWSPPPISLVLSLGSSTVAEQQPSLSQSSSVSGSVGVEQAVS